MKTENRESELAVELMPGRIMEQLSSQEETGQIERETAAGSEMPILAAPVRQTMDHGISELNSPLSE